MEWRLSHLDSKHPAPVQKEQSPVGALDAFTQGFISHSHLPLYIIIFSKPPVISLIWLESPSQACD